MSEDEPMKYRAASNHSSHSRKHEDQTPTHTGQQRVEWFKPISPSRERQLLNNVMAKQLQRNQSLFVDSSVQNENILRGF